LLKGANRAKQKSEIRVKQTAIGNLSAAIKQALEEAPTSDVLSILTGAFVSLTVELVRRQGYDVSQPIKVDGGPNRDITIHPPKAA
jgi:hypothetical protein